MSKIIPLDYAGQAVHFDGDGWFNATTAAARFGKSPHEWLRLPSTQEYLTALSEVCGSNTGKSRIWIRVRRGNSGGTWLHPKLAVRFAQWLDVRFAIWCDEQIEVLLRGTHPHQAHDRARLEAASAFRVMTEMVKLTREQQGKEVAARHFINEARLVCWALTGSFGQLDREAVPAEDLELLTRLEERNAVMLGAGLDYATRKQRLEAFAAEQCAGRLMGRPMQVAA